VMVLTIDQYDANARLAEYLRNLEAGEPRPPLRRRVVFRRRGLRGHASHRPTFLEAVPMISTNDGRPRLFQDALKAAVRVHT